MKEKKMTKIYFRTEISANHWTFPMKGKESHGVISPLVGPCVHSTS